MIKRLLCFFRPHNLVDYAYVTMPNYDVVYVTICKRCGQFALETHCSRTRLVTPMEVMNLLAAAADKPALVYICSEWKGVPDV